jgi:hypothetical protein
MSASKTSPKSAKGARAKPQSGKAATPTLLAGGNPQIAKGEGDAPVGAYIAAIAGVEARNWTSPRRADRESGARRA